MVEKLEGFVPIKLKELVVKSHFDGTAAKSKNMEQNNEAVDGTNELKEVNKMNNIRINGIKCISRI